MSTARNDNHEHVIYIHFMIIKFIDCRLQRQIIRKLYF